MHASLTCGVEKKDHDAYSSRCLMVSGGSFIIGDVICQELLICIVSSAICSVASLDHGDGLMLCAFSLYHSTYAEFSTSASLAQIQSLHSTTQCTDCLHCLQIVGVAQSASPFTYDPKIPKKRNPNKRRRWLIPFLIIAQVAFKVCYAAENFAKLFVACDMTFVLTCCCRSSIVRCVGLS